jgi:type I restriction enzyme M protein
MEAMGNMATVLNKTKLNNLANEIWKSAERLRGKFKAYEYQNVILPTIVIRRIECVLIDWRERKMAEFREKHPKISEKERSNLMKLWGQVYFLCMLLSDS